MRGVWLVLLAASGFAQTKVDWHTQVKNKPVFDVVDYAFTASPGGTVSIGANTKTVRPCPPGINGSDAGHYVRIVGGTGTAEAVLITGGTCTSGASGGGTLIFTAVNGHSGSWAVQSATAGIQEAIQAAGTGTVLMPPGVYTLYAHPIVPSETSLIGSGGSTVLRVAATAWGAPASVLQWRSTCDSGSASVVTTTSGATHVRLADFTVDANGVGQPAGYGFDVSLCAASNSTIERVRVYGARHQGAGLASLAAGSDNRIIDSIVNGAGLTISNCTGGIFLQGTRQWAIGNYVDGACDDGYVANNTATDTTFAGNVWVGSAATAGVSAFHVEDASRASLVNNVCNGTVGTASCFNLSPATSGTTMTDILVSENTAIGSGIGGSFVTASTQVGKRFTVSNNIVRDAATKSIVFVGNVQGLIIKGNQVRNGGGVGIEVDSDATTASQVIISNNHIDHNATVGIQVANAGSFSPGQNVLITGNISTDTSAGGSKVQAYGLNILPANGPPTQFIIRGNDFTGNATAPINVASGMGTLTNSIVADNLGVGLAGGIGAALSSGSTIAPTNKVHHVTGTAAVATITVPVGGYVGDTLTLIPDAAFTLTSAGNIWAASTAVVGKAMLLIWDGTKWGVSY